MARQGFVSRELNGAPTIEINLIGLLHKAETRKEVIRAFTPLLKQENVKLEIGKRIVEQVRKNTQEGYDRFGKKFQKYSKSYRQSDIFKIYKGSKRKVDLKLTGSMQSDMDVIGTRGNNVLISFNEGEDSDKAKGHILGANYLPVRDFFGLPTDDYYKIMLDAISEHQAERLTPFIELLEDLFTAEVEFANTG